MHNSTKFILSLIIAISTAIVAKGQSQTASTAMMQMVNRHPVSRQQLLNPDHASALGTATVDTCFVDELAASGQNFIFKDELQQQNNDDILDKSSAELVEENDDYAYSQTNYSSVDDFTSPIELPEDTAFVTTAEIAAETPIIASAPTADASTSDVISPPERYWRSYQLKRELINDGEPQSTESYAYNTNSGYAPRHDYPVQAPASNPVTASSSPTQSASEHHAPANQAVSANIDTRSYTDYYHKDIEDGILQRDKADDVSRYLARLIIEGKIKKAMSSTEFKSIPNEAYIVIYNKENSVLAVVRPGSYNQREEARTNRNIDLDQYKSYRIVWFK